MKVRVSLPGIPSAGYQWQCKDPERVIGHGFYNPASNSVGGTVIEFMEVNIKENETLQFVYRRAWENEAPLRTLTVTLEESLKKKKVEDWVTLGNPEVLEAFEQLAEDEEDERER